jgi:hypothetical protein
VGEWLVESGLGLLGHPCCGCGVGRVGVISLAFWRLLNAATNWASRVDHRVVTIPLTEEQAQALNPQMVDRIRERSVEDVECAPAEDA